MGWAGAHGGICLIGVAIAVYFVWCILSPRTGQDSKSSGTEQRNVPPATPVQSTTSAGKVHGTSLESSHWLMMSKYKRIPLAPNAEAYYSPMEAKSKFRIDH